ncbi:MAG: cytochrome c-type biogenesis protein CcmH [Acidimicrobiales bacterium]|jgi:cytochrome c-type biogenesis protein CcmH
MTGRRFPLWLVLGVVLVVALAVGSGAFDTSSPTPAQRALAIESGIKCPSCEDLSVADSSAQTAVIVRAAVRQLIADGRTDQQIEAYLADRYGSAIVLDPPTSGWSLMVWVLPLVGGLAAAVALAAVLARRRRAAFVGPSEAARLEAATDAGATADQLDDRRRFLEQSLADAFAEHRAGDLSDGDFQALRRRDTARLAALDLRVDEASGPPRGPVTTAPFATTGASTPASSDVAAAAADAAPRPKRSRRQRLLLGGGVTAMVAALVLVVSLSAADRLPGQTSSGNVTLSRQAQIQQSLAQAATLVDEGQTGEATQLYQKVLGQQPDDEVALAQLGWLEYETGVAGSSASLVADGRADLEKAVQLAPSDFAGRLYLGTVLLQQDGNAAGAVAQYRQFLAADPPTDLLDQAAPLLRRAYTQAGLPVPPQVPAT